MKRDSSRNLLGYKLLLFTKCFIILTMVSLLLPIGLYANSMADKKIKKKFKLQNRFVTVYFSTKGITQLTNRKIHKNYSFKNDQFSITIDGHKFDSQSLHLDSIHKQKNQLVYTFTNPEYTIKSIYQIKPGWDFISKQLKVEAKGKSAFTVNRVNVLQEQLNNKVNSDYIARALHQNLGPKDYGIFLRFDDHTGMFALVQNPFLNIHRNGNSFNITYKANMKWITSYGVFSSDRACLGTYELSGVSVPVNMLPEWKWTGGKIPDKGPKEDKAEIHAFTDCVSKFIVDHNPKPINVNVGWTENDYQIDVSTKAGRDVYKRIIDQDSRIGVKDIVFAPTNSKLGTFQQAVDDWHWENLLWLGLGIKIRKNEWNPETDTIPSSIEDMLSYARSKGVKLMAYVYPVMPFQQNKKWLVTVNEYGHKKQYANLGFRSYQNWLIKELSEFKEKTGIGGYSFDYTFLNYPGASKYAQWKGWQRVLEALRKRFPHIVIDGRQSYQYYGPWSWLAGSYPHPTSTDEQPESFVPFPDLQFDRVSADRARYANYRYRIRSYCPSYLIPGFISHQTPRINNKGELVRQPFRRRDWDYMGWKYSLISSIGMGGLNNVINMIPARDPQEYRAFEHSGDIAFFKKWLGFTKQNRKYLLHARPILGQPAIGKVDGSTAIIGNKGYIFLYNPNGRALPATFKLDRRNHITKKGPYLLKELYPVAGKIIGNSNKGFWKYGDNVTIPMDGARAKVLKIEPLCKIQKDPILFNVPGNVKINHDQIRLDSVSGEMGTQKTALIRMQRRRKIKSVRVNGQTVPYKQNGHMVKVALHFAGKSFHHMQQVGTYNPDFTGGIYTASLDIPQRIFSQLKERKKKWPIAWTGPNYDTPWLVPSRLLLFVQIAQPSDTMKVTMDINQKKVALKKAYSSIRPNKRSFVGFYLNISSFKPDKKYHITLHLPELKPGQFQGMFLENIKTEYTSHVVSNRN